MKPSPGGHSQNNLKSVSVIIAREGEGRAVQRKRECCDVALFPEAARSAQGSRIAHGI